MKTVEKFIVGENTKYFGIDITWSGSQLTMNRGEEFVASIEDVVQMDFDQSYDEGSDQHMMYLITTSGNGSKRGFFMDADHMQTNAREVNPDLENLKDVLDWLLPPGYDYRQGDIGFYHLPELPGGVTKLGDGEYHDYFIKPFHKRHVVQPEENCDYYVNGEKCYLVVKEAASIVHPEHYPVNLRKGIIEVLAAAGEPLPKIIGIQEGEEYL